MSGHWLPIRYREFYDVPRLFAVECDGRMLVFDCPFDETIENYALNYAVYSIDAARLDRLQAASWDGLVDDLTKIADTPVAVDMFDETRRKAIRAELVHGLLEARHS